jgi:hypothetical protein
MKTALKKSSSNLQLLHCIKHYRDNTISPLSKGFHIHIVQKSLIFVLIIIHSGSDPEFEVGPAKITPIALPGSDLGYGVVDNLCSHL